jgi:hypothetical protein
MNRIKSKEDSINTYLRRIPESIRKSWSMEYRQEVEEIIKFIIPRSAPKIVDIKFNVNLGVSKFYIVLLMGIDRRNQNRQNVPKGFSKIGNWIAGILILMVFNLAISLVVFMAVYYIKSSLGINLFKNEHLIDKVNQFIHFTSF